MLKWACIDDLLFFVNNDTFIDLKIRGPSVQQNILLGDSRPPLTYPVAPPLDVNIK